MNDLPWWNRWPEILEREKTALNAAGITWSVDGTALAQGIMCLRLSVPVDGATQPMSVVYPDNYPYFRCQVYAPDLDLPFHQNPFDRNLCLIGRRTHYWDQDDTAAAIITEQLPKLLTSAAASTVEAVAGLEETQAEPFSEFYPYRPSMMLVQSDWAIPRKHRSGMLRVTLSSESEQWERNPLRGLVRAVLDSEGRVICEAPAALRKVFDGKDVEASWARVDAPIRHIHKFLDGLFAASPAMRNARYNHVGTGWMRLWGIAFPEETAHRTMGEGWVFFSTADAKRPNTVRAPHSTKKRSSGKQVGR